MPHVHPTVSLPTSVDPRRSRRKVVPQPAIVLDPAESAKLAGLRYVTDALPGIRRKRAGKSFSYIGLDGRPIRDAAALAHIRSLGIPPAWTDVWICPNPLGHIQATGKDAKGRKQYRYHPRWREVRDATKYDRMIAFGGALPTIRAHVSADLARSGLPRERVLAAVVRLLDETYMRVGNVEYARENESYGLTTLQDEHVEVTGTRLRFEFRGKHAKMQSIEVQDRRVARIVKTCQELPGHELFQYLDDAGEQRQVESADVNAYLREISGQEFSAKDFRTWAGTVIAASTLTGVEPAASQTEAKQNVAEAVRAASERLGNTPAICRKCYVHPGVLDAYLDGSLVRAQRVAGRPGAERELDSLRPEEAEVLALLRHLDAQAQHAARSTSTKAG